MQDALTYTGPMDPTDDDTAGQPSGPRPRSRHRLERPWVRRQLIHELARGEETQTFLAERHQVTKQAITEFKHRHATEIDQVRGDLENEFAGLWVADKQNRIAVYQDEIETISERLANDELEQALEDYIDAGDDTDERKRRAERVADLLSQNPTWARLRQAAIKAVAEELGALPQRMSVNLEGNVGIRYEVVGLDQEKL